MIERSVICQRCKQLVAIADRRWAAHGNRGGEQCGISNTIFTAPVIHRSGPVRPPGLEGRVRMLPCDNCGEEHLVLELRKTGTDPEAN